MTPRLDNVRPLCLDEFTEVARRLGSRIIYLEGHAGVELYAMHGQHTYQPYTTSRAPRRFQSAETARRLARDRLQVSSFPRDFRAPARRPAHSLTSLT